MNQTSTRRVFADNSATPPTFPVGNNHPSSIVTLEPLEQGPRAGALQKGHAPDRFLSGAESYSDCTSRAPATKAF